MKPRPQAVLCAVSAILLAACGASSTPAASQRAPATQPTDAAAGTATLSATPSPAATLSAALAGTRIVFTRDDGSWNPPAFMISPDGSNEIQLPRDGLRPGAWSRDRHRVAINVLVDAASNVTAGDGWQRPATINSDGSGFKILDAYPGRKLNLVPVGWSADESRIYVMSGYDAVDLHDIGLFSVRATDGGGMTPVVLPPRGDAASGIAGKSCARPDAVQVSPDGTQLLVNRQTPKDICGTLLLFDASGRGEKRLNPDGTLAEDIEFGDYVERGRISESWSPDGSRIAFGAFVESAGASALFLARSDGTDVRQIVSPEVGAISAQWSPDASWIAFTSKLRSSPQVWRVHPDGTGLQQLTTGAGGSTSVMPMWSPDGSKLLFQRKESARVTLWTMNADGSDAEQLSPTPIGNDYIGPYAWWPAPPG